MDDLDREIAELEARIAPYRLARTMPNKEIPMITPEAERITVQFPGAQLARIDRYRRLSDNPPTRSEAIRELVDAGLAAKHAERAAAMLAARESKR